MCGEITISNKTAILTDKAKSEKKSVVLNCGSGVALSDNNLFYVAIPAGIYTGLTIRVFLSNGKFDRTYMLEAIKQATVERNTIYNTTYKTSSCNKEIILGDTYKFSVLDDYLIGLGTITSSSKTSFKTTEEVATSKFCCSTGCTITNDNQLLIGRNFDMPMSYKPIYVFKTSFGKYKTFNVAYTNSSTSKTFEAVKADGGITSVLKAVLPYISSDVINEKGLYVSMNMRVAEKQFTSSGTNKGKTTYDILQLPQVLCMNCETVDEAVNMAKNNINITSISGYHLGFMVGDATGKYGILEVISNSVVFTEYENAHSNFWIDKDAFQKEKYPEGLGRYQVWKDNVNNVQTEKQMFDLINRTCFSHFYNDIYVDRSLWHYDIRSDFSEWVTNWHETAWLIDDNNFSEVIAKMKTTIKDYRNKTEDQLRKDGNYWMACSASVINCNQKRITIQLWEKPEYRFVFRWEDNL